MCTPTEDVHDVFHQSRRAEVLIAESLGKTQVLSAFAHLEGTRPGSERNPSWYDKDEVVKHQWIYKASKELDNIAKS